MKDFVQLMSNCRKGERRPLNVFCMACVIHEGDIIIPIVSFFHDVCPLWTLTS